MESKQNYINPENDMLTLREIIIDILNVDVVKRGRNRDVVDARRIYAKILKDMGYSLTEIGLSLGREHTIIIHYIETAKAFMNIDYQWSNKYMKCRDRFYENRTELKINDVELKKSVSELKKENDFLVRERDKYMKIINKCSRFEFIIHILDERVPFGRERFIRDKIIRILNE